MTTAMRIGTPAHFVNKAVYDYETFRACPVCQTPVRKTKKYSNGCYWSMQCPNPNCYQDGMRTFFDSRQACMVIRPEHRVLATQPENARDWYWYHISTCAPDEMEFESQLPMHLGHGATVKAYYNSDPWNHGEKFANGDFTVYKVFLKDDCVTSDIIIDDLDDWDDVSESFLDDNNPTAHVYVNRIEAPGSLSVIAKRCTIKVEEIYPRGILPDEVKNAVI